MIRKFYDAWDGVNLPTGKVEATGVEERDYLKLKCQLARVVGEFEGTLEAIMWWDVPPELKTKLQDQITKLKNIEI